MIAVASEVAGRVVDLPVADGDRVERGQLLLRLDARAARHAVAALLLDASAMEAAIAREAAREGLARRAGDSRIAGRESTLSASASGLAAARALHATAEAEFARMERLRVSGLVAQPTLDRASDALERSRQALASAGAAIGETRAGVDEARAEAGEAEVISRGIEALELDAESLRQQAALRQVALEHHTVTSPISGVIDEVFIDAGEHVAPGQRIALMHDPGDVWIDANVKETEIGRVRPGARVSIVFDAWPGRTFTGHVDRIRTAALSEFALLPTANPSGVFTRITQRVPVRIALDQAPEGLRPGALAALRIRASRP